MKEKRKIYVRDVALDAKKDRTEELESIIQDIWWMARRYADGRKSYAVSMYNEAIRRAEMLGMKFKTHDESIYAKDGMFDRGDYEETFRTELS